MSFAIARDEHFTYADYLKWPANERWELIDGIPYNMTPAPSTRHQDVLGHIYAQILRQLKDKPCRVFIAPFDVRLPEPGRIGDNQLNTVVQPDLSVICDPSKIDERGCLGAPDFIVEVVSPSTALKDQSVKVALYERHGVREYWIVHPTDNIVFIRELQDSGQYKLQVVEAKGEMNVSTIEGVTVEFNDVMAVEAEQ